MAPFASLADWPVDTVAAAVVGADGHVERHGQTDRPFPLASITKLLTARAALVAHEEGTRPLDEPILEGDVTTADLLAHSGGIAPDEPLPMTIAHTRRIYSTAAYDIIATQITERSGIPFAEYLDEAVVVPLGMRSTALEGSAGAGARSSVDDLVRLAGAWSSPLLIDGWTEQPGRTSSTSSASCRASVARIPTRGGSVPRSAVTRRRTGPRPRTLHGPTATSASRARCSGSIPTPQ